MTATIATTEEYWLIFSLCFFECLITPRVPIYWIVGMLKQIWALFFYQFIWLFVHKITPNNQFHYIPRSLFSMYKKSISITLILIWLILLHEVKNNSTFYEETQNFCTILPSVYTNSFSNTLPQFIIVFLEASLSL